MEAPAAGGVRLTRYLLDTNIVSELRKPKPHGAVVGWFGDLREEQICLSAVTLGELQEGIERTRKQDAIKARAIEAWVDELEKSSTILPMDGASFREAARMMVGKQEVLLYDVMIAATARLHGLTVATRNEKDFRSLGVEIINPFQAS
jgi:toxin FitB